MKVYNLTVCVQLSYPMECLEADQKRLVVGYYRNYRVKSDSLMHAKHIVAENTTDGKIDWSDSKIRVEDDFKAESDQSSMIIYSSGRILF